MEKLKSLFRAGSIAAAGALVASPAFAVDTEAVETAIDGAVSSGEAVGGMVIGAVAIMVGIGLVIAIVRKI